MYNKLMQKLQAQIKAKEVSCLDDNTFDEATYEADCTREAYNVKCLKLAIAEEEKRLMIAHAMKLVNDNV